MLSTIDTSFDFPQSVYYVFWFFIDITTDSSPWFSFLWAGRVTLHMSQYKWAEPDQVVHELSHYPFFLPV